MADPKWEDTVPLWEETKEIAPEKAIDTPDDTSILNTILQHGTQGATLGFGEELSGLSEAAGQILGLQGVGGPVTDIGISKAGPTLDIEKLMMAYERGKKGQADILQKTEQANPGTALASDLGGGIAGMAALPMNLIAKPLAAAARPVIKGVQALTGAGKAAPAMEALVSGAKALPSGLKALPPGPTSKAIGVAAQVGKAGETAASASRPIRDVASIQRILSPAAEGALLGGVEGLGRAEDDSEISGALTGAALGGIVGKAMTALSNKLNPKSLEKGADALSSDAALDALASIGGTKKDFAKEFARGGAGKPDINQMKGIGKELLDSGITKMKGSMEDTINKIDEVSRQNFEHLERISDTIQGKWSPSPDQFDSVVNKVMKNADNFVGSQKYTANTRPLFRNAETVIKKVMNDLDAATKSGDFKKIIQIKRDLGKIMSDKDWVTRTDGMQPLKGLYRDLYHTVREYTEDIAMKQGKSVGESFKEANKTLSNLYDARSVAVNKYIADLPKSGISLSDYIAGGIGASFGGPLVGAGVIAAKKGTEHLLGKDTKQIMRTAGALGKEGMSNILEKLAEKPELLKAGRKVLEQTRPAVAAGAALAGSEDPRSIEAESNRQMSVDLKDAPSEDLNQIAGVMESKFGEAGAEFAKDLRRAAKGGPYDRTVSTFKLMQNPKFKEMMRDIKMNK